MDRVVTSSVVDRLVARVTEGFRGDVGVVPRQFLRQFVNLLDLVDQHPDYDPIQAEGLAPLDLTEEERRLAAGQPAFEEEAEDSRAYEVVEF